MSDVILSFGFFQAGPHILQCPGQGQEMQGFLKHSLPVRVRDFSRFPFWQGGDLTLSWRLISALGDTVVFKDAFAVFITDADLVLL